MISLLGPTVAITAVLGVGSAVPTVHDMTDAVGDDVSAYVIQVKKGWFRRDQGYDTAYYERARRKGSRVDSPSSSARRSGRDIIIYYDGGQHDPGLRSLKGPGGKQGVIAR